MTKAELLADLQARFYKVGTVQAAESSEKGRQRRMKEGVMWYLAGVYEKNEDVLLRRNVPFYCEFAGTDLGEKRKEIEWDDLPDGEYYFMGDNNMERIISTEVKR